MTRHIFTATLWLAAMVASAQSYVGMFNHNTPSDSVRRMQYQPDSNGFIVSHNGHNLYTRALYGGNTAFRIETSDRPLFGAYHGKENRNIHFTITAAGHTLRLDSVAECTSKVRGGVRVYELSDPSWHGGALTLTAVAPRQYEGGLWKIESHSMPADAKLTATSCATVPVKLNRNGDMGADPANAFAPDTPLRDASSAAIPAGGSSTGYLRYAAHAMSSAPQDEFSKEFELALADSEALSASLAIDTPDPYFNALGPALAHAADGIYDGKVWMHGAIGWRMPLSGWRGAYTGDFLGWHDRARTHFNAYAASQVTGVEPVRPHPTQDPDKNMARALKEWGTQMYSDGYICRNPERNNQMHHYDMNLCYIDELLWHLKWTGDMEYARQMWPVIKSHLAWEKRNFDPDGDSLYDAYCCIWASDALYYNSGAVTHSSAYNYRANLIAAEIAEKLGEDPAPYISEAKSIAEAMNRVLWNGETESWAEFRDFMGLRRLHNHPALWTAYHAAESGVATPRQNYMATRYIDNNIPHIPLIADGLPEGYFTLSTTDWMPYAWSINNVAFAEVYHTSLAYWMAGRPDAAAHLLKSAMLDGMYLGNSPGNIGQISHYDAARGECYRDFADPVGVLSRALVQGLFGFSPDAIAHRATVTPGFPSEWNHASISHPDFSLSFLRKGDTDIYTLENRIDSVKALDFRLRAPREEVAGVKVNGRDAKWHLNNSGIEFPVLELSAEAAGPVKVEVEWKGKRVEREIPAGFTHPQPDAAALGLLPSRSDSSAYEPVDLTGYFNADVSDIFRNRYMSPRSPYTTLQLPVQGIGEWCHPDDIAEIADNGRKAVFTTLFDNYPDSVTVPLGGSAREIELVLAGSTNHMQCYMENARVTVNYTDGTSSVLPLIPPYNWAPIEQDYYIDGKAFRNPLPRMRRMLLTDGQVSDNLEELLGITGVYGRRIPGGAAVVLNLPLDSERTLESLTLTALSTDIVAGLLSASLLR